MQIRRASEEMELIGKDGRYSTAGTFGNTGINSRSHAHGAGNHEHQRQVEPAAITGVSRLPRLPGRIRCRCSRTARRTKSLGTATAAAGVDAPSGFGLRFGE